jgi:hypothetical protein
VVVIGTALGSLLILCLSSGIKLYSPLILGGSVIGVDAIFVRETQMLHILALNSDGDIWHFQYPSQSQSRGSVGSELKLSYKASLHPIRSFLGDHSPAMHLESAELTDSGELIISVKASKSNASDWQVHFQYLNELQCWRQITHLKSFLSQSDLPLTHLLLLTMPTGGRLKILEIFHPTAVPNFSYLKSSLNLFE